MKLYGLSPLTWLLLVTAIIYAPVLGAPFVFEDAHAFLAPVVWALPGRGLSVWSVQAVGGHPGSAHLVNLALHLVNGWLVARVLRRIAPAVALWGAAVFLLHPLQTEAVAYVTARGDLLVTLWSLLGVWLALTWVDRAGWWRGVLLIGALVAAALSKEIGLLAVPLVVWTLLVWRRDQPATGFIFNALWGAAGIAVGAGWFRLASWIHMSADNGGAVWPWPTFAAWQLTAVWQLLNPRTWVAGLSIDHDVLALAGWQPVAIGVTVVTIGVGVWAWRRAPLVAWSLGWIGISVIPRFVFATNEFITEYQCATALVGLSAGLGAAGAWLWHLPGESECLNLLTSKV